MTKTSKIGNANQSSGGAALPCNHFECTFQRLIINMEIGECSIADEDAKPAACPQHLTTSRGLDDVGSARAESGIVSFVLFGYCTVTD